MAGRDLPVIRLNQLFVIEVFSESIFSYFLLMSAMQEADAWESQADLVIAVTILSLSE